jgi:hypothetical protein
MGVNRIIEGVSCSECQSPYTLSKGMCAACYSKKQRNTEKGKERQKIYNATLGKEAQKKYKEKNKKEKPLPKTKPNCECGKPSRAKGYCMTCYQKHYQREKYGWTTGSNTRERKDISESEMNARFSKVLMGVKNGLSIRQSLEAIKMNNTKFYNRMTDSQKLELKQTKLSMSNFGQGATYNINRYGIEPTYYNEQND